MVGKISLEVVTPEKLIVKEDVDEVVVPGIFGEFGILPGHTTFLTELGTGPLSYSKGGKSITHTIRGGFAEVRDDHVTILADSVD